MLGLAVTATLMIAVLHLPEPAPTLAPPVLANLPANGVANPITGVLLAFRALDTLLEAIVLVIALILLNAVTLGLETSDVWDVIGWE